jgi:hypothetical protein
MLQYDASIALDYIKITTSNSSSIAAFISIAAIMWHLLSLCLARGIFAEPLPINCCLCWLKNAGF